MKAAVAAAVCSAVFLSVALWSTDAEARRGIIIYQSGEDIFEAGPLPEPFDKDPSLAGAKAGFKCSVFGLFWAYLHIWDCKPVAFIGDRYDDSKDLVEAIGKKYKESDMKVGIWAKHGRWLIAVIVLGGIVMAVMRIFRKKES